MKKLFNRQSINKTMLLFFVIVAILELSSCKKKDPEPSQQEILKAQLTSGTWTLQGVTVDNVDQTAVYQGLTINFTETTYTTTKGGQVWPASGTWTFTDDETIKRDDGTEVKVEATDTSLKLTLIWAKTTLGTGRVESVKGLHVFTFRK